jgi:diaminopimelate epimerase
MRFEKWQALGNDYLIVERDELPFAPTRTRVRGLCEPHFGLGADGLLLLSRPANPEHVADLRIFNPDGSEAELSGNGAREAIMYLRKHGWTDKDEFAIGTPAGEIRPRITGTDTCTVDMGRASLASKDFPSGSGDGLGVVIAAGREWRFRHVSIGNPQCAIHVGSAEELSGLDLGEIGSGIEGSELFPNRTNVSWYTQLEPARAGSAGERIRARIFERGVGETLASGTGATGAAIAHVLQRRERGGDDATAGRSTSEVVTVVLDGGELEVEVGADLEVGLTGWARPVYEGRAGEALINELKELDETE